jgi:SanA protein
MALPINTRLLAAQFVLCAAVASLISVNLVFVVFSEGRLSDSLSGLPRCKAALVLGTSSYLRSGQPSPFFDARIQAAAWIWQVGKADYLLVSGDNQFESYNEPVRMKQALVDAGVPAERIVLDYAGFSTLDSIVRAKKVFGQSDILVVSQEFQNQRAVFIGAFFGMRVTGYNARNPDGPMGWSMELREFLARPKAFLDVMFLGTQPRFLGEAVVIP